MKKNKIEIIAIVGNNNSIETETFAKILQLFDFQVEIFNNADFFVAKMTDKYSGVLLQIDSEVVNDIDIIGIIRERNSSIAILVITAIVDFNMAIKCFRLGADDYITKPIEDLDIFNILIRRANEKSQNRLITQKQLQDIEKQYIDLSEKYNEIIDIPNAIFTRREISFPPGYHQAGISILNYFTKIVNQRYPHIPVEIRIEQDGNKVFMTVLSPDGNKEIIEKTLEEYGLVLSNKMAPEDLLNEPYQVMALKQKLDMAKMETKHTLELMKSERIHSTARIESLEKQVENLYFIVASGLESSKLLQNIIDRFVDSNKDIISTRQELENLKKIVKKSINKNDEREVKDILLKIQKKNPPLLEELYEILVKGSISSAAGNYLLSWIVAISNSLPR